MRPTCRTAFAVLVGSFLAVGCANTDDREEPLVLGKDTQNRLLGGAGGNTGKAAKVAAFDPSATGGSGVSVQNSFNRPTPGPGTGTSTGNFASREMPSQVGLPPPVTPPALQGASYGEPMPDAGRTAMTHRAAPPPPPAPPTEKSPFGPPNLDPPVSDPSVRPATATAPAAPTPPAVIPPVMLEPEKNPLPVPVTPVSPVTPVAPVPPPAPGAAANESLPMAPAPPTFVPSPTDAPIPGVQSPPKLPPAPPIRPNG